MTLPKPRVEAAAARAMIARLRLKQATRWFAKKGKETVRSQSVIRWIACQAWLSASRNPPATVRAVLTRLAPTLSSNEIQDLTEHTKGNISRWTSDQCAEILQISVWDREALQLWHLGAIDDYDYAIRSKLRAQKSALRVAKFRAKIISPRPRGRPRKTLTTAQIDKMLKRKRKMTANRVKRHRKCNAINR